MKFILTGDIVHAGRILVEAADYSEAVTKADSGDFVVFEEGQINLSFEWNGEAPEPQIEANDQTREYGADAERYEG